MRLNALPTFLAALTVLAGVATAAAGVTAPTDFKYINYDSYMDLVARIKNSRLYGSVFRVVEDGFKKFNVNPVPFCTSRGKKVRCQSPLIEIANFHKGEAFVQALPTAFLVAGFHGDEVVGTNSFYYLVELIMERYAEDPYYATLLDNVHILMLPMANVNGFNRRAREEVNELDGREKSSDPNRDFPYDPEPKMRCYKTSTALLIDAIFRKNLVIGCLTFHGGDNSVTYPWGNFPHEADPKSGDHVAFSSVAEVLRDAGWNNPNMSVQTYTIGTMQDIVYNVRGGFEDWAYGASFDTVNINKRCGVYDNPEMGLVKDDIKYDQTSNRAFVYLVEAGFSKIPDERFLGDAVPLRTQDFSQGKWGHLTRNINLSFRFAQVVRPYATVQSLSYSNVLTAQVSVYGCKVVDEVTSAVPGFSVTSQTNDKRKNIWNLTLQFGIAAGVTRSLAFSIKCDKKFADRTGSNSPQSHLVKLRTLSRYSLDYNGKRLTSYPSIDVTVLNIRTDNLRQGLIHWLPNNVNALTYLQVLKTALPDVRKQITQVLSIHYSQQTVSVVADTPAGTSTPKQIRVRAYGGQNAARTPKDRHLYTIEPTESQAMSVQYFLGLAGRDVDVYEQGASSPLFTSTLAFDLASEEEEERNALMIPTHGLNCRSGSQAKDFLFAKLVLDGASLRTDFFSPANDYFTYKVGAFGGDLVLQGPVQWNQQSLYRYSASQKFTDLDDLRLLLRKFRAFKGGNQVFECVLVVGDPDIDPSALPKASPTAYAPSTADDQEANSTYRLEKLLGIAVAAILTVAVVYFLVNKFRSKKQAIEVPTSPDRSFERMQI